MQCKDCLFFDAKRKKYINAEAWWVAPCLVHKVDVIGLDPDCGDGVLRLGKEGNPPKKKAADLTLNERIIIKNYLLKDIKTPSITMGERYGISPGLVRNIRQDKAWKDVPATPEMLKKQKEHNVRVLKSRNETRRLNKVSKRN